MADPMMTMHSSDSGCPSEDMLLLFVAKQPSDPVARANVEAHIDSCASCRVLVASLAAAQEASQTTRSAALPSSEGPPAVSLIQAPAHVAAMPGLAVGARVSRYEIERELGRGGMGVVYAAHDPSLDRKIALKIVRPDSDDPNARARIMREARAMAKLAHPNVVTIHDVGELSDGQVFLAMELVDGTTLRAALRQPAWSLEQKVDFFVQAGRGLAAAHRAGFVHRDFKPDNALVGRDGRVRVMDFGLVRPSEGALSSSSPQTLASGPGEKALTASGYVLGTPAYMAPEQHLGLSVSAKVDQYAFAIALYEALAGARPFRGTYDEIRNAKLDQAALAWPPSVRLPPLLAGAIERALRRDPDHRFPNMEALLEILEASKGQLAGAMPAGPAGEQALTQSSRAEVTATQTAAPGALAPTTMHMPSPPVHAPAYVPAPSALRRPMPAQERPIGLIVAIAVTAVALIGVVLASVWKVVTLRTQPLTQAEITPPPVPSSFRSTVANQTPDVTLSCAPGSHLERSRALVGCFDAQGAKNGPVFTFHANGKVQRYAVWQGGKRNGMSWELDDAGRPTLYEEYASDKRDGLYLLFDAEGRVATEAHYKRGEADGVRREWRDGQLTTWQRFENGAAVETKRL